VLGFWRGSNGKQPEWQWLDIDSAVRHCTAGAGTWDWAGISTGEPDVVMACAGAVPILATSGHLQSQPVPSIWRH
jgi:phosphoketolase